MVVLNPRLALDSPVKELPKVKPLDLKRLTALGIRTVRDLLLHLPFAWDEFGDPKPIAQLTPGTLATVTGTIIKIAPKISRFKKLKLTQATLEDDHDDDLNLVWFNQPWIANQLEKGDRIAVAGTVRATGFGLEMRNPHHEKLEGGDGAAPKFIGGLMPRYHLVKGLTSKKVSGWVDAALPLAERMEDELPEDVRERNHLLPLKAAVRLGHKPVAQSDWDEARRRMGFAELFELQAAFALMRASMAAEPAVPIPYRQDVIDAFKSGLGFELTKAQRRSTWEAFQDMQRPTPMNRLLNGDVGSGKTAVAAACAAMVHAAGMQSVVMAPTEILARQHLHKFRAYLEQSFPSLTVELLVSSQSAGERRRVRTSAASGHCALVVGTHALIEEDVEFADLGLAVVDEQHRFGTRQRELLRAKGKGRPHFLAMTATPIPRSLALALFGEMAISVIDELPPGRTPVKTAVFERLRKDVFPDLTMDLIHGRLKEKDDVMRRFVAGEIQVLVATAVVEVGVDVPNATVMMIEGADRFGLAQLHQFRGRVGRGAGQSHCLLLTDDPSEPALNRLSLLTRIRDGFKLAEEDMQIRGMGELMGPRQHGMTDVAMQALRQPELLSEVRQEAESLLESDPGYDQNPLLKAAVARRLELTSIS